uniref:Uncharacterized protein n=1 Tax=Scleropages formosus TaxID=113540 RepID=A0A8C9R9S5_SCLFO
VCVCVCVFGRVLRDSNPRPTGEQDPVQPTAPPHALIHQPQPPGSLDYRHAPPCLAEPWTLRPSDPHSVTIQPTSPSRHPKSPLLNRAQVPLAQQFP